MYWVVMVIGFTLIAAGMLYVAGLLDRDQEEYEHETFEGSDSAREGYED